MSSHVKFCSCKACRAGRKTLGSQRVIRNKLKAHRQRVKLALRKGEEPPRTVSVSYTD